VEAEELFVMKVATVAIVVRHPQDAVSNGASLSLVEVLSDEHEIHLLESSCKSGEADPLEVVHDHRKRQHQEEGEFGNYVEDLLSQPFVGNEIQEHGVQWLKSKIRIEKYQKTETDAAKIIAEYAMKVLSEDPEKTDFFLAGPSTMVRIRVFSIGSANKERTRNRKTSKKQAAA
jgi:hypothetical protein